MQLRGRQLIGLIDSLITKFQNTSFDKLQEFVIKRNPNIVDMSSPQTKKRTFYRRELPSPPATSFSSKKGKQLFREALKDGYMEGYFNLAEQFRVKCCCFISVDDVLISQLI